jgi:hypothetical protein
MVSQPSMRPTFRTRPVLRPVLGFRGCLGAAAIALLFASGCGQPAGGRCQIDSDCASGLVCSNGSTGNGICNSPTAGTLTDAAASADAPVSSGPETQAEIDAEPAMDAEPASGLDATAAVDTGAID